MGALFAVGGTVAGGLIGFLASVKANRDANKAAMERIRMEHSEADRTRFHHLRVELYAKLFAAVQALRVGIADTRPRLHEVTEENYRDFIDALTQRMSDLIASALMVQLVASQQTCQAASELIDATVALQGNVWNDHAAYMSFQRTLDETVRAFSKAARAELLPPGDAWRFTRSAPLRAERGFQRPYAAPRQLHSSVWRQESRAVPASRVGNPQFSRQTARGSASRRRRRSYQLR